MAYQRVARERPSRDRVEESKSRIQDRRKEKLGKDQAESIVESVDVDQLTDKEIKHRVSALMKNEAEVPVLRSSGDWEMKANIAMIHPDGNVDLVWNTNGEDLTKTVSSRDLLKWRESVMESVSAKDERATEKMTASDYEKLREESEHGDKIAEVVTAKKEQESASAEKEKAQTEALEAATAVAEGMDIRSEGEAAELKAVISEDEYKKLNVPNVDYFAYVDAKKELIQMKSQLVDERQTVQSLKGTGLKRMWNFLFPPKMYQDAKIKSIQLERKISAQEGIVGPIDGYIESQQVTPGKKGESGPTRRRERITERVRERGDKATRAGRSGYGKQ
jgi:hypothetical protein